MPVQTEATRLNKLLEWEEDLRYSRENVTIISGQNLAIGTVVAQITASGKYTQLAPGASDGSETAAGFVIADYDASAADIQGVIIARTAIVRVDELVWPDGIAAADKTAALATMEALGIISDRVEA